MMSPTDLAAKAGISVPYASQLLSGDFTKRRQPSLQMALRIYDATGLQLGALSGLSPEEIETSRKVAA